MVRDDFAVIIVSHGRADNVETVNTLKKYNYSGRWYILIDDEDNQAEQYKANFGEEHIVVFCKEEVGKTFDIMDNFPGRQVPTFARNALTQVATDLGLTYFLELEDDYYAFRYRFPKENGVLGTVYFKNFDDVVNEFLDFLETSGAHTIAFAQTGDLLGGVESFVYRHKLSRKAMNCFFCKTDRPFQYFGRFNDDVNSYLDNGKRGYLFFTLGTVTMDQPPTQQNAGGITDAYRQYGTYVKSFYSVMLCPSAVVISEVGRNHRRLHHLIDWEKAVPKIVSSRFKKE